MPVQCGEMRQCGVWHRAFWKDPKSLKTQAPHPKFLNFKSETFNNRGRHDESIYYASSPLLSPPSAVYVPHAATCKEQAGLWLCVCLCVCMDGFFLSRQCSLALLGDPKPWGLGHC